VADHYDLGQGAGFYVDAERQPWSQHYRMYSYITRELPALLEGQLPLIPGLKSISGHSMGGHGALICALKNPGAYRSVSAFAPICNPVRCGWGQGCFEAYLGADRQTWKAWDTTCLIEAGVEVPPLFIDQGTADEFLAEQLHPGTLETACATRGIPLTLRWQEDYDHSYHFIATFIGEHLGWHARALRG
jgi:S-formylglutathione hydrolase